MLQLLQLDDRTYIANLQKKYFSCAVPHIHLHVRNTLNVTLSEKHCCETFHSAYVAVEVELDPRREALTRLTNPDVETTPGE